MEIDWNIPDAALLPQPSPIDDPEAAKRKLDAEMAEWVAKGPPQRGAPQPEPESQDSPPVEEPPQEPVTPTLYDEGHIKQVYQVQAMHGPLVDALAKRILGAVTAKGRAVDPTLLSCALGRALVVMNVDIALALAALEVESSSIPQPGQRVREENGATGRVVSIVSLAEAIVKWDNVPRAMVSPIEFLTAIDDEK